MGNEKQKVEEFRPKGASAFFIALMILYIIIYFVMYAIMLGRG